MKAVRQLSPIHRMAPWLRTYGSYQGRECSTRPCHGSGYAHSALEHSQLTYGDAIRMSGMQLLRCWYCAIPGLVRPPLHVLDTISVCMYQAKIVWRTNYVPLPSTDSLLHSKPTMLELLDHVVLRVAARWYHFGLALGVEDYLLEDIKATERGEVEACCTDMLVDMEVIHKRDDCRLVYRIEGSAEVPQMGWQLQALLEHCSQQSELCCVKCGSSQQVEVGQIALLHCFPIFQVPPALTHDNSTS